jgi:hypothetical protein
VRCPPPVLVLIAALAVALAPSAARADGDPASDVLITNTLYTPVAQKISPPVLRRLQGTIEQANAGGFKVRVALILDRSDLGAVPQLFGHPVKYVKLLSAELFYAWKGAIIAVQPSGIGVQNIEPLAPAQSVANAIRITAPSTADGLALAANDAIRTLAGEDSSITFTADGTPAGSTSSSSLFTTRNVLGAVLVVMLILLLVGQIVVRRRRATPDA